MACNIYRERYFVHVRMVTMMLLLMMMMLAKYGSHLQVKS
jgi:hypothetical protein